MRKSKTKQIYLLSLTVFTLVLTTFVLFNIYINRLNQIQLTPYDVIVSDIQPNSVVISWKTVKATPSYIKLNGSEDVLGSKESTQFHRVNLLSLKENSKYSFVISQGEREWSKPYSRGNEKNSFTLNTYSFRTTKNQDSLSLPAIEELHLLPNELVYLVLYDSNTNKYSSVRSFLANKYGGVAVDLTSFGTEWKDINPEIYNIQYFLTNSPNSSLNSIYANEINCNQNIKEQSIEGITKDEFVDLATRWTAGRGKNYAAECWSDVIYRSKMAGVDPAFTLAVWLNESGASNYTQDKAQYGYIEDWGIHGRSDVPVQDFNAQINFFLKMGHYNICPGLTLWEAWGNVYRYGTCNTDNPVAQREGIEYYKGIESLYTWITNGKKFPKKVNGNSIPINENIEWKEYSFSKCCSIKVQSSETLIGKYSPSTNSDCTSLWPQDKKIEELNIEYALEIPSSSVNECQVEYEGVCCNLESDIKWYPKKYCTEVIDGVKNSDSCKNLASNMACYLKNGTYKWLPKIGSNIQVDGIKTKQQCDLRNTTTTYTISLKKGVNFVGVDFTPSLHISPMYASSLLEKYPQISLIGNYKGYSWKDLVKQSNKVPFVGNDFYLEQNMGYLIVVDTDLEISLDGWKDTLTLYPKLEKGWNLVNGSIYSNIPDTSSLISNISTEENSSVAMWEDELNSIIIFKEENLKDVKGVSTKIDINEAIFLKR